MKTMKDSPRAVINLNLNWKFFMGDEPRAWYKGFDDTAWRTVDLPHDWSVEHPFDKKHASGTGYLPGGIGVYRKRFFLPEILKGKRVYITFDGVYNNSMVWCNSYYLGKRPYGYSEFIYDITDFVQFGDTENVLTVRVNHEKTGDSRWFTGSGIYRKVTLTVKDHICLDNYGVFISTKSADQEKAVLSIQSSVTNHTEEKAEIKVKHLLINSDGEQVSTVDAALSVSANGSNTTNQALTVHQPNLWSTDSPYLYTCVTEIIKDGAVIDRVETAVGIRTFRFDPDQGFYLNGINMKLKGVCVHHDAGCLGAAVREKVWERRLLKLKEAGCNAIRMSHNPHMPELYDLCDRLGFLVMDEAFDEWEGVKNKWVQGHNVYPPTHNGYYEDFHEWHERDLAAMVLRDRNHPSVILWSIGNEIDYPNDPYCHPLFASMTGNNDANKPAQERIYDPNKPDARRLVTIAKELVSIVKKYDSTRPVTAALAFPELSNLTGLADCLDVVGYNYKEHLYEEDHRKYPNRTILGSENGKNLEQWLAVKEKDYISSQFLWTGVDFLGETKGWPSHGSWAGILDLAGFEKPTYYYRQSMWSDKPMAKLFTRHHEQDTGKQRYLEHLTRSWNYFNGTETEVICFTNCLSAELFLNGKSLGRKDRKDAKDGYLTWTVPFEQGELKVIAADDDGVQYEDILKTTGAAAGIKLHRLDESIKSDGLDITHVVVSVVDGEGNLVPSAQDTIYIAVDGPGMLMGLENGNLEDNTPYCETYRRAHNGKLLVYIRSTGDNGEIKVKAWANHLGPTEAVIQAANPLSVS
jgi:beta-galactosidase